MLGSAPQLQTFTGFPPSAITPPAPIRLSTEGFEGFSVCYEPAGFGLAGGTARNFGMKGGGKLFIWNYPHPVKTVDFNEGVYGVSWCHGRPNLMLVALSNGEIGLINLTGSSLTSSSSLPSSSILSEITKIAAHSKEVCSVECSRKEGHKYVSTSYDGSIRIGSISESSHIAPMVVGHDGGIVYEAKWSPREPHALLSAGADHSIRLWDERIIRRSVSGNNNPAAVIRGHENEVLSVDWNPLTGLHFVSGSSDQTVRLWDFRQLQRPLTILRGHRRAVRRVKWAQNSKGGGLPSTNATRIYSVGYDMALRVWNPDDSINPLRGVWEGHTEFIMDVDVDVRTGEVATAAWDQSIYRLLPPHWGESLSN